MGYAMHILHAKRGAEMAPKTKHRIVTWDTADDVTITLAKFNALGSTAVNGVALPDHCQVQGIINERVGVDGYPYGDSFEVRLPALAAWNGRFMFQGGGGTEGAVPPAVGIAGTLSPTLAHGWAVASQDGGHQNQDERRGDPSDA
jgi:feruloyl esterase